MKNSYRTCINKISVLLHVRGPLKKEEYRKMNTIRSYYKHQLYTEEVNKKALGAFDDKRYILENGIKCLPYGYKY